jgi:proteasome lid subunit RPN8/RPN11
MDDGYLDSLMRPPSTFYLSSELWKQMRDHVSAGSPEEVCGLIAGFTQGDSYHALKVIPVTNILHSPFRYRMDPEGQIQAFNEIETMGVELVGIYHSHPNGPDHPSKRDIEESYYPECANLIWFRNASSWSCRGYFIQNRDLIEVPIIHSANS